MSEDQFFAPDIPPKYWSFGSSAGNVGESIWLGPKLALSEFLTVPLIAA